MYVILGIILTGSYFLFRRKRTRSHSSPNDSATLTIGIITFNEENNIIRCLDSCAKIRTDKVLVVDSFSTDRTVELCQAIGIKGITVKQHPFADYASQRNVLLAQVTTDYVLMLDADEELTEELGQSITEFIKTGPAEAALFQRRVIFQGQTLHHVFQPDRCLKLFRHRPERVYRGIVHEELTDIRKRDLPVLNGYLNHYSWPTMRHYMEKLDHYAQLDAQKGKKARPVWGIPLAAGYAFVKFYLLKRGFLDGVAGLMFSIGQAFYVVLKGYYTSNTASNPRLSISSERRVIKSLSNGE